jgi:hypothetical protein
VQLAYKDHKEFPEPVQDRKDRREQQEQQDRKDRREQQDRKDRREQQERKDRRVDLACMEVFTTQQQLNSLPVLRYRYL